MKKNILQKNENIVSQIITSLMTEIGIKESELARQTGLPQTTINRLLLGDTFDPRANTLKPIAKFFGVTIGQLLGEEPLNNSRISGTYQPNNKEAWSHIPILEWEDTLAWIFKKDSYNFYSHKEWITTEKMVSKNSFALYSKPFMEPRFRKNSLLIVDPEAKLQDGKFVVIALDNKNITVRQILIDEPIIYLKHFDSTIPSIEYKNNIHNILGVIVEARLSL
jgi:SOS-response transcriptional repressor LexA